jgi:hypothetical protein
MQLSQLRTWYSLHDAASRDARATSARRRSPEQSKERPALPSSRAPFSLSFATHTATCALLLALYRTPQRRCSTHCRCHPRSQRFCTLLRPQPWSPRAEAPHGRVSGVSQGRGAQQVQVVAAPQVRRPAKRARQWLARVAKPCRLCVRVLRASPATSDANARRRPAGPGGRGFAARGGGRGGCGGEGAGGRERSVSRSRSPPDDADGSNAWRYDEARLASPRPCPVLTWQRCQEAEADDVFAAAAAAAAAAGEPPPPRSAGADLAELLERAGAPWRF